MKKSASLIAAGAALLVLVWLVTASRQPASQSAQVGTESQEQMQTNTADAPGATGGTASAEEVSLSTGETRALIRVCGKNNPFADAQVQGVHLYRGLSVVADGHGAGLSYNAAIGEARPNTFANGMRALEAAADEIRQENHGNGFVVFTRKGDPDINPVVCPASDQASSDENGVSISCSVQLDGDFVVCTTGE